MTKKSYDVSTGRNGETSPRRSDRSFVLCLCTMLVILTICILLLLVSSRWCNFGTTEKKDDTSKMAYDNLQKSKEKESSPKNSTINDDHVHKLSDIVNITKMSILPVTTEINVDQMSTEGMKNFIDLRQGVTTEQGDIVTNTDWTESTTLHGNNKSDTIKINSLERNTKKDVTTMPETTIISIKGADKITYLTKKPIVQNTTKEKNTTEQKYPSKNTDQIEATTLKEREKLTTTKKIEHKAAPATTEVNAVIEGKPISTVRDQDGSTTDDFGVITQVGILPSLKFESIKSGLNLCNSSKCDLIAARIISSMDLSKAPCENFYEFACGGVFGKKKMEMDIFSSRIFEEEMVPDFVAKFHSFYHSCVTHEDMFHYDKRIGAAKKQLFNIGSFQFDGQTNKTFDITVFVAKLILFKAMPLFEVDVDVDADTNKYILKLLMPDQTSLELDHWSSLSEIKRKCLRETDENAMKSPSDLTSLYRNFRGCQKNYSDYLDSIETAVKEFGFYSNLTQKGMFDIRVFIEFEILSLFDELDPPTNLQEMKVRHRYEVIKLEQLKKEFPLIQWENLFTMISNLNVNNDTLIQMYNRKYFEDVFRGLSGWNRRLLNNAFLAILANSLYENTILPVHRHSRVEFCKKQTQELMPDIANYLYKKLTSTEEFEDQSKFVETMYNDLKIQFDKSLENLEWLDVKSYESVKKKIDGINLALFRNDDILSEMVLLNTSYAALELVLNGYQDNLFNLMKFRRRNFFSLQGEKVTPENMFRHFVDVTGEEPVFFYTNDIVCIPYGLVKKVAKELPAYITMAQVGFSLAKIIGHAVDPIGIRYKIQLNEDANSSYINFAEQTRDMVVLSNPIHFREREFSFTLNNALSETERIAENTALGLLTKYFTTFGNESLLPWISNKYSQEKIFFLALAQEFCRDISLTQFVVEAYESHVLPAQFRIENILGNSKEFLEQFHCRPGSAMTRIEDRIQFPNIQLVTPDNRDYL
ncbi:hypothetical protein HHI36_005285 [Cryptolaemus montrouzieri]|uniref:Uncharacterized protein n=1 Tax=Cryptolaemus montrouzieri TaxID=559131 RepID=A0ABD2NUP1_9CUCU